ncbi:MAG: glutamine synthetase family protein [Candidatus Competibacterales bacterium]
MNNPAESPFAAECEAFWARHPAVDGVELLLPDTNAVLRGKWLAGDARSSLVQGRVKLPRSVFAIDVWGGEVVESRLIFETGDRDGVCMAIPGTLKPVPWRTDGAQVLLTMVEASGEPFFGDPRQQLGAAVARLRARGLAPVVAMELEFYLVDVAHGVPRPPVAPGGERREAPQLYGIDELRAFDDFFAALRRACRCQDLPLDALVAEYSPGQYEVNLHHVKDPLLAADQLVMLKRAVRETARSFGLAATFMAKPYGGEAGSGLHVHVSLMDRGGVNALAREEVVPPGALASEVRLGPLLRHAVGGLLASMGDAMALFAPHANSYRRFQAHTLAPLAPTWGYDNRTAAVRIPACGAEARRLEHRVAGADANPYLVLAAILGGIEWGLERAVEPPPAVVGDGYLCGHGLPRTWEAALEAFEQSAFIAETFGVPYRHLFHACKRQELDLLSRRVSDVEYASYLQVV